MEDAIIVVAWGTGSQNTQNSDTPRGSVFSLEVYPSESRPTDYYPVKEDRQPDNLPAPLSRRSRQDDRRGFRRGY